MNFELAIRAEFATMHLMRENKLNGPVDLFLKLGYDLMLDDPKKWDQIQEAYKIDIKRCLKSGIGNRKGFDFAYRKLENYNANT